MLDFSNLCRYPLYHCVGYFQIHRCCRMSPLPGLGQDSKVDHRGSPRGEIGTLTRFEVVDIQVVYTSNHRFADNIHTLQIYQNTIRRKLVYDLDELLLRIYCTAILCYFGIFEQFVHLTLWWHRWWQRWLLALQPPGVIKIHNDCGEICWRWRWMRERWENPWSQTSPYSHSDLHWKG